MSQADLSLLDIESWDDSTQLTTNTNVMTLFIACKLNIAAFFTSLFNLYSLEKKVQLESETQYILCLFCNGTRPEISRKIKKWSSL